MQVLIEIFLKSWIASALSRSRFNHEAVQNEYTYNNTDCSHIRKTAQFNLYHIYRLGLHEQSNLSGMSEQYAGYASVWAGCHSCTVKNSVNTDESWILKLAQLLWKDAVFAPKYTLNFGPEKDLKVDILGPFWFQTGWGSLFFCISLWPELSLCWERFKVLQWRQWLAHWITWCIHIRKPLIDGAAFGLSCKS